MHKSKIIKLLPKVKTLAREKRKVYLKYRNAKAMQKFDRYKEIRNRVNQKIKDLKEEY